MAILSTIEKLISAKVIKELDNTLVAKKICTMETESEIKQIGDTVYFTALGEPEVGDYTGTITYDDLDDGSIALIIDQKKKFAFKVDDIEKFRSTLDLKGATTERAIFKLRDTADKFLLKLAADNAGTTVTPAASITSVNVIPETSRISRLLAEKNIPEGQRWIVIPEWYKEKLELAGVKFQINDGMDGSKGGISWVKYRGMDYYVSNNLVQTGSEGSYNTKIVAGSYNAIVYAEQILKTEVIERLESTFGTGVRGLHVYGAKMVREKEVICLNATQANESWA